MSEDLEVTTRRLLAALAADPSISRSGPEVVGLSRLKPRRAYPALARLERDGLLESYLAGPTPMARRVYRITRAGLRLAADHLGPAAP